MGAKIPRLIIAGLSGDSGKTIASLSLLTALRRRGLAVAAFKKGPDYIDAAWLSHTAGCACRNLDTYMVDARVVRERFACHSADSDITVIEGNRGLFDGKDVEGTHSTASLAKLLGAPVVLVVDATKTTRTVAALVKGCLDFDPDLSIGGVILNRVAGPRHRRVITEAIERYCKIPVLGVIPKLGANESVIPGRHLGLVTPAEFASEHDLDSLLAGIGREHLDLDAILKLASEAPEMPLPKDPEATQVAERVRIAVFQDSVFTFYYPENLEALEAHGATIVPVSALDDPALPDDIDALYIGGGFPETQADRLTANRALMASVCSAASRGLPIYAECGGLIYLARSLSYGGRVHQMAGVFPVDLTMNPKPVGHGYTELEVVGENPFFVRGTIIRGHEFHYSGPSGEIANSACMNVKTGVGLGDGRDGLVRGNAMGLYTHLHADGAKGWAEGLVNAGARYRATRSDGTDDQDLAEGDADKVRFLTKLEVA